MLKFIASPAPRSVARIENALVGHLHLTYKVRGLVPIALVAALVIAALTCGLRTASGAQDRAATDALRTDIDISGPFLQRDPKVPLRCGEPEITQDVLHPNILVMDCMSNELNYQTPMVNNMWAFADMTKSSDWRVKCYTFISRDRGDSWQPIRPQPLWSDIINTCGDPMAAAGPHGELYLLEDGFHFPATGKYGPVSIIANVVPNGIFEFDGIQFTRSLDGGKTWSKLSNVPTAVDRPFSTVDESTGAIFEVSGCLGGNPTFGPYGCLSNSASNFGKYFDSRDLAVSTDEGRTWTPSGNIFNEEAPTTTLTPGRLHMINADGGANHVAAARGVFATAGNGIGAKARQGLFKYSTNDGATFTEHWIPLGGVAASCPSPNVSGVAADPTRRGTFAVIVLCAPISEVVRVFVTHDLGATWKETADLDVPPPPGYIVRRGDIHSSAAIANLSDVISRVPTPFLVNRPWVAYGPTGALGVIWRENYGNYGVGGWPHFKDGLWTIFGPQDVFVAISADGGTKFAPPIRVNTMTSPAADPRQNFGQDESGLILGRHYAYAVWGDWRSGELETWFRRVPIGGR